MHRVSSPKLRRQIASHVRGRTRTYAIADNEYLLVFIVGPLEFADQFGNFPFIHLRKQPSQSFQIVSCKPNDCVMLLHHSIKMILLPCGTNRMGIGFSAGNARHIAAW